jgi:flagellar biosynthetic protein FliR
MGAGSAWASLLAAGVLVMVRLSGVMVFAPVLSSPAIPARVKAMFVLAMTVLVTPVVAALPQTLARGPVELTCAGVLGELAAGLLFGLCLQMLMEGLLFASALLGIEFSFSLANLMDPNSMVETPVLGQLIGWLGVLVLIGAGCDRMLLAAVLRSFATAPVGSVLVTAQTGRAVAALAGGIFVAGVQLAAPVMAATLAVEVTLALISKMAPQLPLMFVAIPVKTLMGYAVLIGSLALWPAWVERHFERLLHAATQLVAAR